MAIGVLLVDDHRMVTDTLSTALAAEPTVKVLGAAATGEQARELCADLQPDVALVDIALPDIDGIALSREIRALNPGTKILMLTGSTDPGLLPRAMAAGACGFLIKEGRLSQIVDAIHRAHAGEVVVPESVALRLTELRVPSKGLGSDLTARETNVLCLLAEGTDPKMLAKALGVTWHTARSYIKSVLMKLDAHSQLEAVTKALRLGIITLKGSDEGGTTTEHRR